MVFWHGQATSATIGHSNVGDYRLFIRDTEWTQVDNPGNFGQDCIPYPNSGYSSVPANGLVGCTVSSNYDTAHLDGNVSFRPYGFDLSGVNFNNTPNNNFIYINNVLDDPYMAIHIDGQFNAVGKGGSTLSNFSGQCYGKDTGLNFVRTLTPDESTLTAPNLLRYLDTNTSETNTTDNNDTDVINKSRFLSGSAVADLVINIDRRTNIQMNPIDINITQLVVGCLTAAECQSKADQTNHDAVGNQPYNFFRHLYYGRVHAPDYRTDQTSIQTPIYAEVYCDPDVTTCTDYEITSANGWRESVDDINWWINPNHANSDGNITEMNATVAQVLDNDVDINGANPNTSVSTFTPTINYTGTTLPHRTRIFVKPSDWLKYHRFFADGRVFYNVTFEGGASDWGGIGKLGKTVETNASKSTSHRIEW